MARLNHPFDRQRTPAEWPTADLERVARCPVCGAPPISDYVHARVLDDVEGAPGTWAYRSCGRCGSAYLDPRPTRAAIGRAYASYYTHASSTAPLSATGKVRRRLQYGYLNARGYHLSPSSFVGRVLVPLVPGQRDAALRVVRHLSNDKPESKLLDLGCGSGAFLAFMGWQGWVVTGIDPDPGAVAAAEQRGLRVSLGMDEGLDALQAESFDAVTLNHVIEHSYDPKLMLRRIHRVLRPGGVLWVATPNLAAIGHRRFGASWRGLEPPRHLTLFRPESLRGLLESNGFAVVGPSHGCGQARWYYNESRSTSESRLPSGARLLLAIEARAVGGVELLWRDRAEEIALVARRIRS